MAQKHQIKKGFLKLQRLGPVKFAEQSRWSVRAPETMGMWAFPYPYFDSFFAYHKYIDLAPKDFRDDSTPKDPKWYNTGGNDYASIDSIEFVEVESYGEKTMEAHYRDEEGNLKPAQLDNSFYHAKEEWIKKIGKKVLPLREFWYSGEIYTHFNQDGSVGSCGMDSTDPETGWTLMSTTNLAKLLSKNESVVGFDGHYDGAGKPLTFNYSKDHLEIFIPRGKGVIRDKL